MKQLLKAYLQSATSALLENRVGHADELKSRGSPEVADQ
jgi:hypothetical protein